MKNLFGYFIVLSFPMSFPMWAQTPVSPNINQLPTRQFGQPSLAVPLTQASPNLVEGREVDVPGQIAFDTSVNPPIMYIADVGNNRVLAFKNPAGLANAAYASLVIGQQDQYSTLAQGPSTTLSTGLNAPTGVAVDSKGNLYVADSGNNRILRFPTPFQQPSGNPPQPDLVIGQQGFSTGSSPNQGSNCASKTLAFTNNNQVYLANLAIDGNGNLWVTDPINNRVLMYPPANLSAGAVEPVATVVLGQNDFATCSQGNTASGNPQLNKAIVTQPSSLAFDASGNLYVADNYSRVLFYQGPAITQGQQATRVLGVVPPPASGQPSTVYPTQYSLGYPNSNNNLIPPNGVFTQGNHVYVADTGANRIVEYDIPANWSPESSTIPSPAALAVFGQNGFAAGQANQGLAQPSAYTMSSPYGGAFLGTQMWVADSGNNRVLGLSLNSASTYSGATVLIGQLDYPYNAPNLIVGDEVYLSGGSLSASGMVVDNSSSPPRLYIADPGNNRILCFKSALTVGANTPPSAADMVIGEPDFKTSEVNYPNGIALSPSATGLNTPIGVAVDNNGNLYVADSGNGRVVRFPAPFNQPGCPAACSSQPTANLVLGQSNFTTLIQNASSNSMHTPWGVALFSDSTSATPLSGSIAVSDPYYNRVLIFKKQAGGDFASGENASTVFGQSNFSEVAAGNGLAAFNNPRGIASDTSDRLYVADSQNGRVMEFTQAPETFSSGATSTNTITGLNQPQSVAINSSTTELWVTNSGNYTIQRYPEYNTCVLVSCNVTATLYANAAPLGMALDASGNVIVGDAANRVTLYFAQAFYRNAANYNTEALAPGMLAILGRLGLPMNLQTASANALPWPTTLADINVTVNGTRAPIFATLSGYGAISFQVPYEAPTSGTANFIVTQASTGAVLSVGTFQMAKANPGFFTANQNGLGPVVALNLDTNLPNNAANGATRGGNIELCLTGLGQVSGAPADGQAPSGAVAAPVNPVLYIDGIQSTIIYSGLGCGFPGGWQINATVPMNAAPSSANSIALTYLDVASNIGGTTSSDGITPGQDTKISTTIYVK